MHTDYLIALDNAQAQLGDLYVLARRFRDLRPAAEAEFLPAVTEVGLQLRRLRRQNALTEERIAAAAADITALRERWQQRIDATRATPLYAEAVAAYADDRQEAVAELLPRVLAATEVVTPPACLYFGVRVSAVRRGPGSPPFIDSAACVERVVERIAGGLHPAGSDETGFAPIAAVEDAGALDSPVSLALHGADMPATVFRNLDDSQILVYSPHLVAPFVAALCDATDDSWWLTSEEPYPEFRDRVAGALRARGYAVHVTAADDDTDATGN